MLLHRLSHILRLEELAGLLQIIDLEENDMLSGVISIAEDLSLSRNDGLACGTVLIEPRLPFVIVLRSSLV